MANRILDVRLEDRSLDPVSAEVWITVRPEQLTATTELRGRLRGPSCPYSNTVEIAYPLLPLKRAEREEPGTTLRCRVVIPEASLWDPESPFLYSGPIELWQDGQFRDRVQIRHGLRRFSIGPGGLRLNGKQLSLEGRIVESLTEAQAMQLRNQGCNLLVTPLRDDTSFVWEMGDRLGFLVLGQRNDEADRTELPRQQLSRHPSCLGWLREREVVADSIHFQAAQEGKGFILHVGETRLGRVLPPAGLPIS